MSELLVNTIKKADGTGSLSVPAESGTVVTTASPSLGRRNRLINGDFSVWQRGTSSTSTGWGYYTADRWNTNLREGSGTMSQYALGDELQPFIYAFKTAITSAATTAPVIQQKVEDSRTLKNQQVTLSFYAKASKAITVSTGFDLLWANSSNSTTAEDHSVTTSWQRFTYTVTLPDPSGTYNATYDHLYTRIFLPTSDTYDVYITGVQLEVGSVATPFEHRSYGEELALCQRYYQAFITGRVNTSLLSVAMSTSQVIINLPLLTTPRVLASHDGAIATGTLTKTGDVAVNGYPSTADNVTGIAYWTVNTTNLIIGLNTSATLVQYNGYATRIGNPSGETVFTLDLEL